MLYLLAVVHRPANADRMMNPREDHAHALLLE